MQRKKRNCPYLGRFVVRGPSCRDEEKSLTSRESVDAINEMKKLLPTTGTADVGRSLFAFYGLTEGRGEGRSEGRVGGEGEGEGFFEPRKIAHRKVISDE